MYTAERQNFLKLQLRPIKSEYKLVISQKQLKTKKNTVITKTNDYRPQLTMNEKQIRNRKTG